MSYLPKIRALASPLYVFFHIVCPFSHFHLFLDTHVSLAPTHLRCWLVGWLVGWSHFWISILSESLVALHEKLKREDPNYFSILGPGKISWNWSGGGGGGGGVLGVFYPKKTFLTRKLFWPKKLFWLEKTFLTQKLFGPQNFFDPQKIFDLKNFFDPKKTFLTRKTLLTQKLFWPKNVFDLKDVFLTQKCFWPENFLTQSLPSPNFFKPSILGEVRVFRAFASLFILCLTFYQTWRISF